MAKVIAFGVPTIFRKPLKGTSQQAVTSHRKHLHNWYKSLAGGFRCSCEAWRCEFAAGSEQCDSASEPRRKYCQTHLASKPQ